MRTVQNVDLLSIGALIERQSCLQIATDLQGLREGRRPSSPHLVSVHIKPKYMTSIRALLVAYGQCNVGTAVFKNGCADEKRKGRLSLFDSFFIVPSD